MPKWGVLTLWTPYEVFDTKEEAEMYARILDHHAGIHGFVVEDDETD